jgi:RNA polymerase-binding transcription factor DksA
MMKHLSIADIRELHGRLAQTRIRLLDEIQAAEADIHTAHEAREGEGGIGSDVSEITRFEELRRAEIAIDEEQLRSIEAAEARMGEGLYGICVTCGEPIMRERLLAMPAAVRCADCESRQAASSAGDGGERLGTGR